MTKQTICGVSLDAFKSAPTPAELAAIVADMPNTDQAEFFVALAEQMQNACGWRMPAQVEAIGRALVELENHLCDGGGSALIARLAEQVAHAQAEAA